MADFLEERLPLDLRMGAVYRDEFSVEIIRTVGGSEFRRLRNPYMIRHYSAQFTSDQADLWNRVIDLYHRAFGTYAGFRVKCLDDFTTNGDILAPTPFDHPAVYVSAGVYQLSKRYGVGGTPLAIGFPTRSIYKPIAATARVGIGALEILNSPVVNWSVSQTTGLLTFSAAKSRGISAITQAAQAVITVGASHGFLVGDYPYISGVLGMTQINGLRAQVTAIGGTTITVNINSSGFSVYSGAAGTASTAVPQGSEVVTAGFEFDIPCRFNSPIDVQHISNVIRDATSIDIVELITP